jgi:hypothetical protein
MLNVKGKYFFCYSHTLHKFIHNRYSIKYICVARNEKDDRKFWLYEQTPELSTALTEYNNIFKGVDAN